VDRQPAPREGQAGPVGVAERPVVLRKSGNAGGGKAPQLGVNVRRGKGPEIGVSLATPIRVQAFRAALHAKRRDPSSGSRMGEIRLSGSTSEEWKRATEEAGARRQC
jgi:hypothetical protein